MSCSIHRCELSKKPNIKFFELERYYFSSFLNKFWFWMVLDENHPRCKQYLVSLSFAKKERHRQAVAEHWWVIHPFSQMRLVWEVIMTALYFIAFITIPFSVCFVILDYEWICLDKVNFVVYAICWIDIIINSLTGYYEKNKDNFVMDQTAIFKRYLKTYLFIDIISSLPYDHITQSWRKIPGPDDSFTITLINLLPLLKLCRYVTFISYIQQINLYFGFEEISCQMFLTLLLYLYVVHWFTCFSNLTALIMMFAQHIPVKDYVEICTVSIKSCVID